MSSEIEIRSITKVATEGFLKALVTLRIGPMIVRGARIMEKEGRRWLSMPSRKTRQGNWLHLAFIPDPALQEQVEKVALAKYQAVDGEPEWDADSALLAF